MNGWFGPRKVSEDKPSDETPAPSLPSIWYRSPELYELERRAVFSRKWLLVSHKLRFLKAGDFVRITEAGFQFFLIKDREGNINAFHNVCRHRAYPIIERDCGTSRILACKYHGWSYSFKGALAKAPKYQDLAGFQKESNGLFRIHVHIDGLGFIWVNLDSSTTPGVPWEEDFKAVDCQPRLRNFNFEDYNFDHQWEMLGEYNWKTLADNYNELTEKCYHCPTGHPALNSISDFNKYWVETKGGHIIHFNTDKPNVDGLGIYSTFYYPNACMTVTPHFFYMMRCSPISATQTHMEYEVYRHKDATDEEFTRVSDTFKQVLREDKDLCNAAQKNLNASIFIKGELHPQAEKGPLYFQKVTRDLVTSHREKEEKLGRDIWPATPQSNLAEVTQKDIEFCNKLKCSAPEELAW